MSFYQSIIRPILFNISPETAHEFGIKALKIGLSTKFAQDLTAKQFASSESFGELSRFGLTFKNPLGIAAGFDKNGVVVNQLASLGFGFVEVGTVTYEPQAGNSKPRLFRLPDDDALINRLGFNNDGAFIVAKRIKNLRPKCVVGINIGKNKDVANEEATENYLKSFDLVHPAADYIAVNISSPNTPDLRDLQKADSLDEMLGALQRRNIVLSSAFRQSSVVDRAFEGGTPNGGTPKMTPLLVKIAPDLTDSEIEAIVDIALRHELAGIIATNTTISREGLKTRDVDKIGAGGLSGRPLAKPSTDVISKIFKYSKGRLPIIGVGGIFTAADAFKKITAGASLVQAYTGFIYVGPSFARAVNNGLTLLLKERGFKSVDDAVGSAHNG